MLEYVLYSTITILSSFIAYDYNFFLKMVTLDSLFNAIHFMTTFININLSESQIVTKSNSLYNGSLLDRYIYYSIVYGLYKIVCTFLWQANSFHLYFVGLMTIIPFIINKILKSKLFDIIREGKEYFVKVIISKILTIIIKFYSKIYLDKNANIKNSEILILLKDYRDTVNYFTDVIKNILFIFLLSYVKNYSTTLYYGIIKYIYNYKTGDLLDSYNVNSAKSYLTNIIDNRKWHELSKPNAYKAILYLYQINSDKTDLINTIITQFNFSLVKMFTVWTISSIIGSVFIIPILSFAMLLFKKIMRKGDDDKFYKELFIMIISSGLCLINNSYILISFVSQFGTQLLFNKVTFIMIKIFYKKIKKIINIIINNNRDLTLSYIITIIYTIILKHLNMIDSQMIIGLNILFNIMVSIEIKKQIIFSIILISTYISNYNIIHVIFNTLVLYLAFGCIDMGNMYTFQDTIKIFLDSMNNLSNSTLLNWYSSISSFYYYYALVRQYIRSRLRNIYFTCIYGKKNKDKKLIFDLMDTEKFPSISTFQNDNDIKLIQLNKSINSNNDSVSFDDQVFDQPIDEFINGISVEENEMNANMNINKKINVGCYELINNYIDAN